ncbi:hypothetical protein BDV96DRAFT_509545, partial [Lophiotrema nucula]
PPFLRLPVEFHKDILDLIITHSPESLLTLRLTNRYFYTLIQPPAHTLLLAVEQTPFARTRALYTCRYCVGLRPHFSFADAMLRGRTGLNGKESQKQFCADWGLKSVPGQTRYSPGTEVVVNGVRKVWCKACFGKREGEQAVGCTGVCKGCHKKGCCGCRG